MVRIYDKEVNSIHNERFIRNWKNKIYKFVNSVSKHVYIYKLDDIVNEYNNAYHRTVKMKPVDVKSNTYINFSKQINDEDSKFKIGDIVRISKCFCKRLCSKLVWRNLCYYKNTVPWPYVISDLKGEEIAGFFYEKELQQTNKKEFRVEKVSKRECEKLYVR